MQPGPHIAADIAVTLDADRPGALARAIGGVSSAGINIDGYAEMNGIVHILTATSDLQAARRCLGEAGFREVQEQDVVVIPVQDELGAAARVFQQIAEAHINVRYSYLATGNRLVISANDAEAVIRAVASPLPSS